MMGVEIDESDNPIAWMTKEPLGQTQKLLKSTAV